MVIRQFGNLVCLMIECPAIEPSGFSWWCGILTPNCIRGYSHSIPSGLLVVCRTLQVFRHTLTSNDYAEACPAIKNWKLTNWKSTIPSGLFFVCRTLQVVSDTR